MKTCKMYGVMNADDNLVRKPFAVEADATAWIEAEQKVDEWYVEVVYLEFTQSKKKKGFPPLFRMARCRRCPHRCKPTLTVNQARKILEQEGSGWQGKDVCAACNQKNIDGHNKKLYESIGREYGVEEAEQTLEELEAEIARLTAELERLKNAQRT